MRDAVHFLVFDGLADGQAARALCEIRRPGQWQVQAAGFFLRKGSDIPSLMVSADGLEALAAAS